MLNSKPIGKRSFYGDWMKSEVRETDISGFAGKRQGE